MQAESLGRLATERGLSKRVEMLQAEITRLNSDLRGLARSTSSRAQTERNLITSRRATVAAELRATKAAIESRSMLIGNEAWRPRFFRASAIRKNRDEFAAILHQWYKENPYIYKFDPEAGAEVRIELLSDDVHIAERVEETIKAILGESDPISIDSAFPTGRGKHFMGRRLDIPNSRVIRFIETNPMAQMRTYSARVDPQLEFTRRFGTDVHGVRNRIQRAMVRDGHSTDEINAVIKDYHHMYERVAGSVLKNPDALNQKVAFFLREAASFSFMGGAGLAAIPDFGRIMMEHDMPNVIKGVQAMMDRNLLDLTVDEVRKANEALDMFHGSAYLRLMEDMSGNVEPNQVLTKARNAIFTINALGPMTTIAKQLAGIIDTHVIIDYSIKLSKGTLDDQSIVWLARHGIDEEMAKRIARAPFNTTDNGFHMANTSAWEGSIYLPEIADGNLRLIETNADGTPPGFKDANGDYVAAKYNHDDGTIIFDRDYIEGDMFEAKAWTNPRKEGVTPLPEDAFSTPREWSNFVLLHEIMHSRIRPEDVRAKTNAQYENLINQRALAELANQKTINIEMVEAFRVALNSNVMNTIMMGTPADKPILVDGVAYLPMSVAENFGMKEYGPTPGYARVENGLLGLPFQFYSFTLANVNKTAAMLAHGQVKSRAIGMTTMMGLAYWSLSLRTPDYVWEQMSWRDKFTRSFDMSGISAMYSDLFYNTIHTSMALGGPNPTGGIIQPKFPQEQSALDAVLGVAGAGPSWAADTIGGFYQAGTGDVGEGMKTITRNLPFMRWWFWKDDINRITHAWAN